MPHTLSPKIDAVLDAMRETFDRASCDEVIG